MSGARPSIRVPVLAGAGLFLEARTSQYGDYHDFELEAENGGDEGAALVAGFSDYAASCRLVEARAGSGDCVMLAINSMLLYLAPEAGEALANFLGTTIERAAPTTTRGDPS